MASDLKLITCRICGTIMARLSRDICHKCYQAEEEAFVKIKDFLRQNPGAAIWEVAQAIGLSEEQVTTFVNSGRLERVGVHVPHTCQTCHRIITNGLICPDCSTSINQQVQDLKKTIQDREEQSKKEFIDDSKFRMGKKKDR